MSDELPHADAAASSYEHYMAGASGNLNPPHDSSRHRYNKNHPAPLEVGMYVLLSFFGMAVVVFSASCIVYSWRGNVSKRPPPPSPMSTNDDEEMTDSITNAHDWVWLGRATLERASGIGQSSGGGQDFINLSDLNGNNQQNKNQQQFESENAWKESRLIRHTTDAGSSSSGFSTGSGETDSLLSEATPIGTTFTRDSKGGRRVTFNNLSARGKNTNQPPQPPHRNIGVSASANTKSLRDEPPPVPPHGINVIANPLSTHTNANSKKANRNEVFNTPKFVEVNADDFVRLRGVTRGRAGQIRRATILENPLLSAGAAVPDQDQENAHGQLMDYDQLLSYFSALKESNA